ncbi:MAG: hypothetical protein EA349_00835 [Halomonadaceae bacterium]|nr:MAG: hypothetical protein EA349_00835 [Halomonadaceae bacterium]
MKLIPGIVLLLVALFPIMAQGHGAGYEPVDEEAVAIRFAYVLGEPMTGAEVQVMPPGSQAPHQVARADRDGRFAFVPDRPGDWTVIADDGAGHRVQAVVSVSAEGMQLEAPRRLAVPQSWLLGGLLISLLVNAGLVSALLAARKR